MMYSLLEKYKLSIVKVIAISILSATLSIYMNHVLQMSINFIFVKDQNLFYLIINILSMCSLVFLCDQVFEGYLIPKEKIKIFFNIREKFLFKSPFKYYNNLIHYSLGYKINFDNNLENVINLQVQNIYNVVYYGLEIILFSLYLIFFVHWKIVILAILLIPFVIFGQYISKKLDFLSEKISDLNGKKDSFFSNTLNKVNWIRANNIQSSIQFMFDNNLANIFDEEKKFMLYENIYLTIQGLVGLTVNILVPIFAGYLLINNKINQGGFIVATNIYSRFLLPAIMSVIEIFKNNNQILKIKTEVEANIEMINNEKKYIYDLLSTKVLYTISQGSFSYGKNQILNYPSISINDSGLYVIRGSSGSGKSTFLKILSSIYMSNVENMCLNSKYFSEQSLEDLIAFSSKESMILGSTIEEAFNVRNRNLIEEFMKKINMENLYKVYVDENFSKLSGGEKELLLIIRALVSKKKIIFIDELGFALDNKNKNKLYNYLLEDRKSRLYIIATHDNELDNYADKLFSINDKQLKILK